MYMNMIGIKPFKRDIFLSGACQKMNESLNVDLNMLKNWGGGGGCLLSAVTDPNGGEAGSRCPEYIWAWPPSPHSHTPTDNM